MRKVISIMILSIFLQISAKCIFAELSKSIKVAIIPDVEFDTSIVRTKNLDVDDYGDFLKCVSLNYDTSATKDLTEYLKGTWTESLKEEILRWSTKNSPSGAENWKESSFLNYGNPSSDEMIAYYVSVKVKDSSDISDRLIVVVVNRNTETNFSNWLTQQNDNSWLEELPATYARVNSSTADPEPATCTTQRWEEPKDVNYFHPGALSQLRSTITENSHGHQACYDNNGNFLRSGLEAGTADKSHHDNLTGDNSHWNHDVAPFIWAAQLDGNPVKSSGALDIWRNLNSPMLRKGQNLDQYLSARPTIANDKTELNPDNCSSE